MTLLSYGGVFTSYVYLEPQIVEVADLSGAKLHPFSYSSARGLKAGLHWTPEATHFACLIFLKLVDSVT